jgi:hypothetical protein
MTGDDQPQIGVPQTDPALVPAPADLHESAAADPEELGEESLPGPPPIQIVEHDRYCIQCGYNLLGLPISGVCPECGMDVARSLRGDLFRFGAIEHVQRLHRGAAIAAVMAWAWLPLDIASGVMSIFIGAVIGHDTALIVWSFLACAATLFRLYGWWLFTTPEVAESETAPARPARRTLRFIVAISACLAFVSMVAGAGFLAWMSAGLPSGAAATLGPILSTCLGLAGTAAWIAGFYASLVYLRRIGPRVPDRTVTGRPKKIMLAPAWIAGQVAVGIFLGWLAPLLVLLSVAVGLITLIYYVVIYLDLLARVRDGLRYSIQCMQEPKEPVHVPATWAEKMRRAQERRMATWHQPKRSLD